MTAKQLRINYIDSFRFMPTFLSELVDIMSGNLTAVECE